MRRGRTVAQDGAMVSHFQQHFQSVSSNRVRIQEQMVSISKGPNWSTECNSQALFQALCDLEFKNLSTVFYPIIFHASLKLDCLCHLCFYLCWSSLTGPSLISSNSKLTHIFRPRWKVMSAMNNGILNTVHNTVNQPYTLKIANLKMK